MCFRPLFGKAKMCLGGVIPQLFVYNFQSKCAPLKRILAFPNIWSKKHIFWVMGSWKFKIGSGTPCTLYTIFDTLFWFELPLYFDGSFLEIPRGKAFSKFVKLCQRQHSLTRFSHFRTQNQKVLKQLKSPFLQE